MLFNSQIFLLSFFPLALIAWFACRQQAVREWVMVAVSLAFYAYGEVRFLPLLLVSILFNWGLAQGLFLHRKRRLLWSGVAVNLAILGYFKYKNFFLDLLMPLVGQDYQPVPLLLPIGISFFTFHHVSYLIDLQRGTAPLYGLRRYFLYMSYFPQLIAGPIVRHNEFMPQLDQDPLRPDWPVWMGRGLVLFLIGLAKKFVLADQMAPHANAVFAMAKTTIPSLALAWSGATAYSLQIYFDFSAYSDMAIGLALMMGLTIPTNFNAPYRATTVQDFWRRWHMTLSRFLRDYLYIPLGGSHCGEGRCAIATMIAMGLCGLWHGASWTFCVWGLMHGGGLLVFRLWQKGGVRLPVPMAWAVTMVFVMLGWVLFRAETFEAALHIYQGMVGLAADGPQGISDAFKGRIAALAAAVVLLMPTSQVLITRYIRPWRLGAVVLAVGFMALVLELGKERAIEFIYFQF